MLISAVETNSKKESVPIKDRYRKVESGDGLVKAAETVLHIRTRYSLFEVRSTVTARLMPLFMGTDKLG